MRNFRRAIDPLGKYACVERKISGSCSLHSVRSFPADTEIGQIARRETPEFHLYSIIFYDHQILPMIFQPLVEQNLYFSQLKCSFKKNFFMEHIYKQCRNVIIPRTVMKFLVTYTNVGVQCEINRFLESENYTEYKFL